MKIYGKRGDEGDTSLLFGGRISKTDPRATGYGTTDEAVSAMGMARALPRDEWVKARLREVQRDLFTIAAELATDRSQYETFKKHFKALVPERTVYHWNFAGRLS